MQPKGLKCPGRSPQCRAIWTETSAALRLRDPGLGGGGGHTGRGDPRNRCGGPARVLTVQVTLLGVAEQDSGEKPTRRSTEVLKIRNHRTRAARGMHRGSYQEVTNPGLCASSGDSAASGTAWARPARCPPPDELPGRQSGFVCSVNSAWLVPGSDFRSCCIWGRAVGAVLSQHYCGGWNVIFSSRKMSVCQMSTI